MSDDKPAIKVRETIEVKKFMGDDQTQEPVEIVTVVMEDGVIISEQVIKKGDTNGTN
jgi:hypothetical protein